MRATLLVVVLTACGPGNATIVSTLANEQGVVLGSLQIVNQQFADLSLHVAQTTFLYDKHGDGICFGDPADLASCAWTDRVGLPRDAAGWKPPAPFLVRLPAGELFRVQLLTFSGTPLKHARVDLDVTPL